MGEGERPPDREPGSAPGCGEVRRGNGCMGWGAASGMWSACAKGGDAGNLNEADGPAESGERPGGPDVLAELEVGVGAKIPGGGGCLDSAL